MYNVEGTSGRCLTRYDSGMTRSMMISLWVIGCDWIALGPVLNLPHKLNDVEILSHLSPPPSSTIQHHPAPSGYAKWLRYAAGGHFQLPRRTQINETTVLDATTCSDLRANLSTSYSESLLMLTSEVPCRVFIEENWSWIEVDILCYSMFSYVFTRMLKDSENHYHYINMTVSIRGSSQAFLARFAAGSWTTLSSFGTKYTTMVVHCLQTRWGVAMTSRLAGIGRALSVFDG